MASQRVLELAAAGKVLSRSEQYEVDKLAEQTAAWLHLRGAQWVEARSRRPIDSKV